MKTVIVQFINSYSSQGYEYFYPDEWNLNVGDRVVVDSPSSGYVTAKVITFNQRGKASKWLVQKVDDTEYKARKAKEEERQKILKELDKIDKKVKEEQKYQYLANISPEAALLLNQLNRISDV